MMPGWRTILALLLVLLAPAAAGQGVSTSKNVDITITHGPTPPPGAMAAGLTTLAFDTEFSLPQPANWLGCFGAGAGSIWYQGVQGSDTLPTPCSTTGGTSRIKLATDPASGKQALDLTFTTADIAAGRKYTTIQTAQDQISPCCGLGELFPYGFYMEARYRTQTTPAVPLNGIGGAWWAFWQGGQGLSPFTNPHGTNIEIDHPEHHGELFGTCCGNFGPDTGWALLNWAGLGGGGYFPQDAFLNGVDTSTYHKFAARVVTDGITGLVVCSFVDDNQQGCNTFTSSNAAQYAEKKYMILFTGMACYLPGVALTASCINQPISQVYQCNGNGVCIHFSSPLAANFNPVIDVTGITGASGLNGSWQAQACSSSSLSGCIGSGWVGGTGSTDWNLLWATGDPSETRLVFNGSPTGGIANAMSQIDTFVDSVKVWSCATWLSGPCLSGPPPPNGPNQLSNTWVNAGATQAPTSAPNGATPAIKITQTTAASGNHGISQSGAFTNATSIFEANIAPGAGQGASNMSLIVCSTLPACTNFAGAGFNPTTGAALGGFTDGVSTVLGTGTSPIAGNCSPAPNCGFKAWVIFTLAAPPAGAEINVGANGVGDGSSSGTAWGWSLKTGVTP